jgi:hypothetical protein
MKQLQVEFKRNADKCGRHTFRQIQRTNNTALYVRIRKDETVHSYEAFKIKIVKAGTTFAKGAKPVAEDYESYPGAPAFGRYAYSCKTLEQAEQRYEELSKSQNALDDEEQVCEDEDGDAVVEKNENTASNVVKGKRGRKAKDRSNLKFPKDKFTMKQLELMNPEVSFAFLYQHVRSLLNIEFRIVDSLTGKRGKPTLVYQSIN